MTTTASEPEILKDGQFLPMQSREFEILELTVRGKSKDKGKDKGTGKGTGKGKGKGKDGARRAVDGVEVLDDPGNPGAAAAAEEADKAKDNEERTPPPPAGSETDSHDGEGEDSMEIAISSEYPVKRWYGTEILDHGAGAVDLSRAKRGLSFLVEHDGKDLVGLIEQIRIDDDKKMRGTVRFSENPRAKEIKRDIEDGIRKFISVGYMVHEYVLEKSSDKEGDTYRATKWTPLEASSVSVPADPSVGNGRAAREGERMTRIRIRSEAPTPIPASKPNSQTEVTTMPAEVAEARTAAAEIFRLAKRHGLDDEAAAKMVGDGITVDQASSQILEIVAKKGSRAVPQPGSEQLEESIVLTERDQMEYNIARGIMAMVQNTELSESGAAKRVNCFELEVSSEIEKKSRGAKHGGLFIPWSIRHAHTEELDRKYPKLTAMHTAALQRAGLDTKTSTKGSELIFTLPGEFIQYLYNRMRVKELGAQTIAGLRENVAYPKQTGKVTGFWVGENPGVDVADSALTLAQIPSSPKTYQSSTSYSRQLLAQAVIDVDTLVREDLARDMALAVDQAAISGTGSGANQPSGILNTVGVQLYNYINDAGNGGSPAWDDIVIMTEKLEDVNADQLGTGAWLTTPSVKSKLKRTARLGNVVGFPIWEDDDTVDGYPARSTNQVPKNGTEGTGTALHTLIRGIFETMVISMWGNGFELVVDPYRLKKQGMIELTTFMLTDVTLKYPVAFIVAKNTIVP